MLDADLDALRHQLAWAVDLLDDLLRSGQTCRCAEEGGPFATCGTCPLGLRGPRAAERNRVCRGFAHLAGLQAAMLRLMGRQEEAREVVRDMGLDTRN